MDNILQGISNFRGQVFPEQRRMYERLVRDGQQPKALIIACADSRVAPEHITQTGPGELFVCRNAGNIVPPFAQQNGGVSSAIEYAVLALGVRDIVVCGHSHCGAMKALMNPESLSGMPNVSAWLRHSSAARQIVCEAYPEGIDADDRHKALALENVVAQLTHLRTHPSVAAGLAKGELRLHGWYFDIETGSLLAYDGAAGRFVPFDDDGDGSLAVAQAQGQRLAAPDLVQRGVGAAVVARAAAE